jgi:hypothetical protein
VILDHDPITGMELSDESTAETPAALASGGLTMRAGDYASLSEVQLAVSE